MPKRSNPINEKNKQQYIPHSASSYTVEAKTVPSASKTNSGPTIIPVVPRVVVSIDTPELRKKLGIEQDQDEDIEDEYEDENEDEENYEDDEEYETQNRSQYSNNLRNKNQNMNMNMRTQINRPNQSSNVSGSGSGSGPRKTNPDQQITIDRQREQMTKTARHRPNVTKITESTPVSGSVSAKPSRQDDEYESRPCRPLKRNNNSSNSFNNSFNSSSNGSLNLSKKANLNKFKRQQDYENDDNENDTRAEAPINTNRRLARNRNMDDQDDRNIGDDDRENTQRNRGKAPTIIKAITRKINNNVVTIQKNSQERMNNEMNDETNNEITTDNDLNVYKECKKHDYIIYNKCYKVKSYVITDIKLEKHDTGGIRVTFELDPAMLKQTKCYVINHHITREKLCASIDSNANPTTITRLISKDDLALLDNDKTIKFTVNDMYDKAHCVQEIIINVNLV
jgi:hypothetical protein